MPRPSISQSRQSQSPVQFSNTARVDTSSIMTSGRAGASVPFAYIPINRGDSASGTISLDVELGDMPRPLINGVVLNVQAWFVPKNAHPQFTGHDEFVASYQGETITALGQADREPPAFYNMLSDPSDLAIVRDSKLFQTLGIHVGDRPINTDLIDAYNLIYNFRLAAHTSKIQRAWYATEQLANAVNLRRAFWPSGRFSRIVPDYERALILGELDLDMLAGELPVRGLAVEQTASYDNPHMGLHETPGARDGDPPLDENWFKDGVRIDRNNNGIAVHAILQDQTVTTTLADIDKARTTQAFAKLRSSYAGGQTTGFNLDDAIVAELMQGYSVPAEMFKRPMLLANQKTPVGFSQRFSSESASLDKSLSRGVGSVSLSINLPKQDTGGTIIAFVEMLPEQLTERQSDEWLHYQQSSELPDALRDIQRPEPVDFVMSQRIDALHTSPTTLYGYEPMNNVWNRETTRLGGDYYQPDPTMPWTEQRSALWLPNIVDPSFTEDHWLAPLNFPHDVFADTEASAFELVGRHAISINGITQMGDMLHENNDDYDAIKGTDV